METGLVSNLLTYGVEAKYNFSDTLLQRSSDQKRWPAPLALHMVLDLPDRPPRLSPLGMTYAAYKEYADD